MNIKPHVATKHPRKSVSIRSLLRRVVPSALATAALAFSSCSKPNPSTGSTEKKSTLKIGVSFQEMENPYFVAMKSAFDEAAQAIGAELIVTDARHDVTKQTSDIEDLIQKKINILIINPTDTVGVEGVVRDAKKAGIVVVAVDAPAAGPIDSFVGSKNYDAGFLAGDYLGKILNEKGSVAILDGIPSVGILDRVRGFKDAIARYPGVKIVDIQNGKQERSTALSVTENIIQAHPDLTGLFSVNDTGSFGAVSAIKAAGKDIAVVSVDGQPEAVTAIAEGGVFKATSAQLPRDQARIGLSIALAKYLGANIPKEIPIDVTLLTKDNAKGFAW